MFPQGSVKKSANEIVSIFDYISIDKPKSLQSAINLGWYIPDKFYSNHFKIMVTNEILGGYFGSRLIRILFS